jgi:acyl-coenzyme A thioesterase PaaI-like protein
MISPEQIAALRSDYDECFACGEANPIGLHLEGFRVEGDEVLADWSPRPEYRGFESVIHGGIVAVALDEICAWTAILLEGTLAVTANLDIKFRSPAPPDITFLLSGRVVDRSGSRLRLAGEVRRGSAVVASATGLYLARHSVV